MSESENTSEWPKLIKMSLNLNNEFYVISLAKTTCCFMHEGPAVVCEKMTCRFAVCVKSCAMKIQNSQLNNMSFL